MQVNVEPGPSTVTAPSRDAIAMGDRTAESADAAAIGNCQRSRPRTGQGDPTAAGPHRAGSVYRHGARPSPILALPKLLTVPPLRMSNVPFPPWLPIWLPT